MTGELTPNWWALALRGLAGIIIGLIAFTLPGVTIAALTFLFGAYALVDGILSLAAAFHAAKLQRHWWGLVLEGIVGIGVAAVTAIVPVITLLFLLYLIAAWAVVTGILEIATAIRLRGMVAREWLLGIAGVASVIFGLLLFAAPGPGAIVIAWWLGAYALVFGVLMLALSFRLRGSSRTSGTLHPV
jgi:uncharacterized membrane protein HdeD (DUF308 family)